MSIHRVKDISYNYDEHHDYADDYDNEGEEELEAEDREQLKAGTVAVREELGADFPASEKEIQDALWHYYYDIGKSVAYLKNRKKPTPQPKQAKQKQASRFDNAANAAALKAQASNLNGTSTFSYGSTSLPAPIVAPLPVCMEKVNLDVSLSPLVCAWLDLSCYIRRSNLALCSDLSYYRDSITFVQPLSASDYFRGISWRVDEIPTFQLSNMVPNPDYPQGRLLGGSSKPSKLAALAAARKKKDDQKRTETPTPESAQSDRVVALLDRLSIKKENESPLGSSVKRTKFIPSRQKEQNRQTADTPKEISPMEQVSPIAQQRPIRVADIRAMPSMFAKAICKQPAADESLITAALCSTHGRQWSSAFSLPYIHNPSFTEMNPFAGPSPDDIVLQAQSKGSLAS